jgi:hypothetical protein
MKLSISEIIAKAGSLKKVDEKVDWLKQNDNLALKMILQATYDTKRIEWLVPNSAPPWNKNEYEDEAKPLLQRDARRLKIFIKGGGYDEMKQMKREELFIQFLQDIDNEDADMLAHYSIQQKPFKGLTTKTINKAFPGLIAE